jgi:hypothetical protein
MGAGLNDGLPLALALPRHDACPVQSRVLALEGRMDALADEMHTLAAEVRELSEDLKVSIARSEATTKRTEALNVEMGMQLKRYAEYTERNCKQDERGVALEQRLEKLIDVLGEQMRSNAGKGKARKS